MNSLATYSELRDTLQTHKWVLLYCSASWCKPCAVFSPVVEQASYEFEKIVNTIKIDVERVPEAVVGYGLKSVPSLLLFNDGNLIESLVGVQTATQMTHWLTRNIPVH